MSEKNVSIDGKVALVSGSNRGIGKAITIELLERGAKKVYAGARNTNLLNDLKEKYGERLVPLELDVTSDESIAKAAELASDVEVLINNAGVFDFGSFIGGNLLSSLDNNLKVNLYGPVKLTNAFLETLKKSDSGALAIVCSAVSFGNMPMGLTYSVSKAAAHSVVQGLRGELKDSNLLVSGIYPGPIDTEMTKDFEMDKTSPETVAKSVVKGLEGGKEYIFPDPMSEQMGQLYFSDPKEVEKQFASFGEEE